MRLVIALVAIGFPVALILAWAFELTPQGVERTENIDPAQSRTRSYAWIYKRIAVLPFANMSADKNDEYLSVGVSEELITALFKITGLEESADIFLRI